MAVVKASAHTAAAPPLTIPLPFHLRQLVVAHDVDSSTFGYAAFINVVSKMLAFTPAARGILPPPSYTPPPLRACHHTGRRALRRGLALALELWRSSATVLNAGRGSAAEGARAGEHGHVVLVTGANRGLGNRCPRNRNPP